MKRTTRFLPQLIIGSWLLLLGFLGAWLLESYYNAETLLTERATALLSQVRSQTMLQQFLQDSEATRSTPPRSPSEWLRTDSVRTPVVADELVRFFRSDADSSDVPLLAIDSTRQRIIQFEQPDRPDWTFANSRATVERNWRDSLAANDLPKDLKLVDTGAGFTHSSVREGRFSLAAERRVDTAGQLGYLFEQILPQLGFASFLLVLVTAALWLTFRSFRREEQWSLARQQLVTNLTHELQTPVTTVGVALEALRGELPTGQRDEYLDIGRHELSRISLLIDKLLAMNQLRQSELRLEKHPQNLRELVAAVVPSFELLVAQRGGSLEVKFSGTDWTVFGEATHLTNVLYNLLDNALKYGGDVPHIHVRAVREADSILLSITDHGPGIPPDYLERIFERFVRVSTGDRHEVKGYGLGLSYVAAVAASLEIDCWAESQLGVGSTFFLRFVTSGPSTFRPD